MTTFYVNGRPVEGDIKNTPDRNIVEVNDCLVHGLLVPSIEEVQINGQPANKPAAISLGDIVLVNCQSVYGETLQRVDTIQVNGRPVKEDEPVSVVPVKKPARRKRERHAQPRAETTGRKARKR